MSFRSLAVGLFFIACSVLAFGADRAAQTPEANHIQRMPALKVVAEWMSISPLFVDDAVKRVEIEQVTAGSPAERAGLKAGCFLVSLQGVPFPGMKRTDFLREFEKMKLGDTLLLEVIFPWDSRTRVRTIRVSLKSETQAPASRQGAAKR